MVDLTSFEIPRNLEEFQLFVLQVYFNLKLWFFSTYYPDTYTSTASFETIAWGLVRLLRDVFVVSFVYSQLVKLYRYIRGYGILNVLDKSIIMSVRQYHPKSCHCHQSKLKLTKNYNQQF